MDAVQVALGPAGNVEVLLPRLQVENGSPVEHVTPAKSTARPLTASTRTRLSPNRLARTGKREAKTPTASPVSWSMKGTMADRKRRRSDRAGRTPMRSPGRPTVARREHRQRFWGAIGRGLSSEDAAAEAGVSPAVGSRWFRESGGMPSISIVPHSGRYLSFSERENVAILRARANGVREIARHLGRSASTISRDATRWGEELDQIEELQTRPAQKSRPCSNWRRLNRDRTTRQSFTIRCEAAGPPNCGATQARPQ
jgi:hypothetical protein